MFVCFFLSVCLLALIMLGPIFSRDWRAENVNQSRKTLTGLKTHLTKHVHKQSLSYVTALSLERDRQRVENTTTIQHHN